jgi:hypothetical protein
MRATTVILQISTTKEDTMSTAVTRMDRDTKKLYVAFELGEKEWKLAMSPSLTVRPKLRTVRSRATVRVLEVLERERQRVGAVQVVSCYEAGRERARAPGRE